MTNRSLPLDRRTLVVLFVLGAAVPALLLATGTVVTDSGPAVDANVSERYRSTDALNATQTVTIRHNGTTMSRNVADVTLAPGTDKKRVRFHEGTTRRYKLQVSNGSMVWLHDADQRSVTAIDLTRPPNGSASGSAMAGRLQRLVTAAGLTDGDGRPQAPDVAPLPVVPRRGGPSPGADVDGGYVVEYVETDSVGAREAYVLDVRPATNQTEDGYRQRLWLDSERFYPLRKQTTWTQDGTRRSITTTYTNVTFNPEVPADTFRPEIGPETTVQRPEIAETRWYRSTDSLASQTSITVPRPTLPPEFELTYATRTTGRISSVGLRYATAGKQLTLSKYNRTYATDPEDRDLTINDRPATLDYGPTTSLSWTCEDYRYTVRGTGVETERLVEVGRSLGCSAS
ncbi:hypothetical protein C440_02128 [Haloferax mucosum ATCC BAA-1512]|uniref:Outer membrane lipoprotein carrier protein LolA n=1 Tax=Haloferax mucosum ATCC BAA-1512 TaxID=662479 RepID=M0IPS6_9EURY|nr:outer membrane lipoprotein carrier protein LolA [Haloferax mucosum]ELZ98007.1 hypothetical protein C440_02128 [Haloferax mucosum ATCC BAA-1512]